MFDDNWDYTDVRDFNKLDRLWTRCLEYNESDSERFAKVLRKRLNLDIVTFAPEQSRWFKNHQRPYQNIDIMLPERDVGNVIKNAARQLW